MHIEPLGEIIRNSHRICQVRKACIGTRVVDVLSAVHQRLEDGVFFHTIQGRDVSQDDTTTLLTRLSNLKQYLQHHIAILTDSMADRTWVNGLLRKKHSTQRATQLPVKHVVLDTLENVMES